MSGLLKWRKATYLVPTGSSRTISFHSVMSARVPGLVMEALSPLPLLESSLQFSSYINWKLAKSVLVVEA